MVDPSVLTEVRYTGFKSIRSGSLPLRDFTLLVGRNGSGKSNALDGLWVLSQLATGGGLREVLGGASDDVNVRGGVEGCAPLGSTEFSLGCSVRTGTQDVHLDLTIGVDPDVQIRHERLSVSKVGSRRAPRCLLETDKPSPHLADIIARWDNQKPGPNPTLPFRATQLVTAQIATRVPVTSNAGKQLHLAAAQVLAALRGVFVLDPIPHQMRQYWPARDDRLRRSGQNLSPVLAALRRDAKLRKRLLSMVKTLSESNVVDISDVRSPLGDVMVALVEQFNNERRKLPARLMSDGTLRFLAIMAAVLQAPGPVLVPDALDVGDPSGQTTLVVEELENGLHPSQAAAMVEVIKAESHDRRIRTLATTHSPALLDALAGEDHEGVIVCARDEDGTTGLWTLTELPNYLQVVTSGSLGRVATRDRLRPVRSSGTDDVLEKLFGVS